jgi:hypothetical protein
MFLIHSFIVGCAKMNNKLQAFDGKFTLGEIQTIVNMLRHAESAKESLLDLLIVSPPSPKSQTQAVTSGDRVIVQKMEMKCPKCGKTMNSSLIDERSEKYKEGYRTYLLCGAACCKSRGCGFEFYSKLTTDEILKKGVKYGLT